MSYHTMRIRKNDTQDWHEVVLTAGPSQEGGADSVSVQRVFTDVEAEAEGFSFMRRGYEVELSTVEGPPGSPTGPTDGGGSDTPADPPSPPDEPPAVLEEPFPEPQAVDEDLGKTVEVAPQP